MNQKKLHLAIDANEANIKNRVGSNVYAFEIIKAIYELSRNNQDLNFTILLSREPVAGLPPQRTGWEYKIIKPARLWTQFAESIYLFLNHKKIDVLFTPGHYAPRCSSVPYVSSVMDLAYLKYPDQFDENDLIQLKHWTKYSVKKADKVIAISEFTKTDIVDHYQKKDEDIVVAYPAIAKINSAAANQVKSFFKEHRIRKPYFLFLGTIQPRKNLIRLVEAYEQLCRRLSGQQFKKNKKNNSLPQLVLAGKIGWLSDPIMARIKQSSFSQNIILTGYIPSDIKPALYQQAAASLLLGLHEGFGIPPLESLQYGCIPIVSNTTSLPEVVGEAGFQVDPYDIKKISMTMEKALKLSIKDKAIYKRKGKNQLKKFNWRKSAQVILDTIEQVAHEHSR
jgi:glycosyltransferase involved in cell wall biosynthesis